MPQVTKTPAWAVGMRKLMPGIYVDAKRAMHVYELEICESLGVPYTAENSAIIEQAIREAAMEVFGSCPTTKIQDDEDYRP